MDYIYVIVIAIIVQMAMNVVSHKIGYEYRKLYKMGALIINSVVWSLLFQRFGWSYTFGVLSLASTFLITSSFIDLKYKEIPNSYNLIVAILGGGFIYLYKDFYEQLLLGGVIAFSLFLVIMIVTGAMGGGDVKMAGAIGLFMGIGLVTKFITYSFFLGAFIAVVLLVLKKKGKNDVFPFGPSIAFSGIYMFIFFV